MLHQLLIMALKMPNDCNQYQALFGSFGTDRTDYVPPPESMPHELIGSMPFLSFLRQKSFETVK
jgi:hypothetical protein